MHIQLQKQQMQPMRGVSSENKKRCDFVKLVKES